MPDWFRRRHSATPVVPNESGEAAAFDTPASLAAAVPHGLFTKCEKCGHLMPTKDFERDLRVCVRCGHHHKLSADERIAATVDTDSFFETNADLVSADPLVFPDYAAKIEKGQKSSGRSDALVTGTARVNGYGCVLAVADFAFMGGSMGSVFGEKFVRAADLALSTKQPLVCFCASGGARMQEGLFGLMQMAKTSAAVAHLAEAGVAYVVVLTNPTTGGALASFASLGDVILAEPGATVAFAGARVASQAQTHKPPANYQTAEFQQEHGMVDRVTPRKELPATLARVLAFFPFEQPAPDADALFGAVSGRNGKSTA
jgi:acetyl-CoA carboxylase carboxyl transferase subunit beta